MYILKGSVVYSKAGRDKGMLLLVLSLDGEYAYVADGRLRRVEKPKKKKIKHLQKTNNVLEFENITNSEVRKVLRAYKPI